MRNAVLPNTLSYPGKTATSYGGGDSSPAVDDGARVDVNVFANDECPPATIEIYFSHWTLTSFQSLSAPLIISGVKYAGLFLLHK